jgi:hypothetical protein
MAMEERRARRDYPVIWDYMTDDEIVEFMRWQQAREEATARPPATSTGPERGEGGEHG